MKCGSRVSRFLAWGCGWRVAVFSTRGGGGAGRRRGRSRWGTAGRAGVGGARLAREKRHFVPREPRLRAGPAGSLVLRPKPSPLGLA